MSLILRGIIATPGTLLRGVCALPGAIQNTTVWAVSSAASFTLRKATSIKNTTVNTVRDGWGWTKSAPGRLKRGTVNLLKAGKEAAVAKSVQNYAELFFRIHSVAEKLHNDLSGKVPLNQFNRNDLAQRLEAFLQLKTLNEDDNAFVVRLCADLRDPSVIFDKSKEPEMARLATMLPPDFIPVSQANRNELAERLEEFNELYSLKAADKDFIVRLCADLRDPSVTFDKSKEAEMGRLEQILSPHFAQHKSYIFSKIAERHTLENVPYLSTSAPPKLTPEQTLDGIKEQVDLLKSNAINLVLGSVILNMTLGLYTCDQIDIEAFKKTLCANFDALGISPPAGKNTNLVNFLIEITNKLEIKGMSSEELFKKLVYRVIDHSGRGLLARIHAKFRCLYTSGLISNLVGNLLDNLKDTLVHFAKLPPAKQLEEITTLLIDPLLKYLTDVENGQTPQPVTTTPAAPMNKFWAALFKYNKPGPKTPAELLDIFIEVFLAQFLDKKYQPLTRTYRTSFIEKAYRSNIFVKPLFLTLAGLLWIAGKIIAPLQWTLNETIHYLLRTIIVGLCPGLANSTKDSLEIGKPHAWYSLKNNLLLMLQQIRLTALLPRTEDPAYQPPRQIPAEVTAKLNTLLDKLFSRLGNQNPLQNATAAPGAAQASTQANQSLDFNAAFDLVLGEIETRTMNFFNPEAAREMRDEMTDSLNTDGNDLIRYAQQNMDGNLLKWLKDIIKTSVTDLALDMCAQEGFINGSLLASLTSTNVSGFAATTVAVADAEKQRVDTELNRELGLLGPTILQSVNDATRTDIMYQTEANVFIKSLQEEVEKFQQELLQLHKNPDLSFRKDSQTACSKFLQAMGRLRTKLVAAVDEPTQALLMPYFREALRHATNIASSVTGADIEKTRKQVEAKLDKLNSYLKMPLDHEDEIVAILSELKALNPAFINLNALEKDLSERLGVYVERLQHSKERAQHPLLMLIADYKNSANREIEKTRKQVEEKLGKLYSYLEMPLDNEEEIFAILWELRTLNPTFIDLNAFETDLNERLEVYVKRLQSPKAKEQHPRIHAKPLLLLIADYKDRANRQVEKTKKQVEAKFDELYSYLETPLDHEKKICTVLWELRTLNPTFIEFDAFETALNERVGVYVEQVQSSKKREQLPLLSLVADYKARANTEANTRIKKFKPLEADLRSNLAKFDAWAKGLKFVKVKAKLGVKDAAMAQVYSSPMVGALASAGIQSYGRNLFTFIGNENNLAGVAQRGMEAYLNKPAMMPKRERITDNFFSWGNRDRSHPLTEIEEAKLRARGWVSLTYG